MTLREMKRVAAVLLALGPIAASAFEWTGQIGFVYDRIDTWNEPDFHSYRPHWDLDLRLDTRGSIGGPGMFDWRAAGGWRRSSWSYNGTKTSEADLYVYDVQGVLFDHPNTRLSLSGFANRSDTRIAPLQNVQDSGGTRLVDTYGGTMRYLGHRTPSVELGYTRVAREDEFPLQPLHTRSSDVYTTRLRQDAGPFSARVNYVRENSAGSWVADGYSTDDLLVDAKAETGVDAGVFVFDQYYRRSPAGSQPGSYSLDLNTFQLGYRSGTNLGDRTQLRYQNSRSISAVAGDPAGNESLLNSAQYRQDFRTSNPELFVVPLLDVSSTDSKGTLGQVQAQGGTAGVEIWWRREGNGRLYELVGGPLAGVLRNAGSTRFGYGANGRFRLTAPWGDYTVNGVYDVSYATDLFGRPGWTLGQHLSAGIAGAAGPGRINGQLGAFALRAYSPASGDDAVRSISARVAYNWHRYEARAELTYQNGIAPGTSSFVGDGFLLPVGFSNSFLSAVVGASAQVMSNLSAVAQLRSDTASGPGQPDIDLMEALGGLSYQYGAFALSIEDRYSRTRGATGSTNIVFFRLARAIGTRY